MSLNKYSIKYNEELSNLLLDMDINDFGALSNYLRHLPYGRNSSRTDLSLVVKEMKGTCSSKHAFFKAVAIEQKIEEIKLVLSIYKMDKKNTPGIGEAIYEASLDYMPEAHCYIRLGNEVIDLTTPDSDFSKIQNDVLYEEYIQPHQVSSYKIDFHKRFLKQWIVKKQVAYSFDKIWSLRESCIKALSTQTPIQ